MQLQKSFKEERTWGSLYLVPTPIGNLEDMTFRAVYILKKSDLIAAEDTRKTGLLLKHFDIDTGQTAFHEHNAVEKIPLLLARLKEGQNVAQVSDAGMPSISDPGYELVRAALAEGIAVIALPGASAGITGLIASGLAPQPHIFYGFLPRKAGQQRSFFQEKCDYPETQIFYESPHRVKDSLTNMLAVYGDRQAVLVREMTKLYEEYRRGRISELVDSLETQPVKGECLIIVEGQDQKASCQPIQPKDIKSAVAELVSQGLKPNQAIKQVAKNCQLDRQTVYQIYHSLDRK